MRSCRRRKWHFIAANRHIERFEFPTRSRLWWYSPTSRRAVTHPCPSAIWIIAVCFRSRPVSRPLTWFISRQQQQQQRWPNSLQSFVSTSDWVRLCSTNLPPSAAAALRSCLRSWKHELVRFERQFAQSSEMQYNTVNTHGICEASSRGIDQQRWQKSMLIFSGQTPVRKVRFTFKNNNVANSVKMWWQAAILVVLT